MALPVPDCYVRRFRVTYCVVSYAVNNGSRAFACLGACFISYWFARSLFVGIVVIIVVVGGHVCGSYNLSVSNTFAAFFVASVM